MVTDPRSIDICLVCEPGGHYTSMQFLEGAYDDFRYALLSYESPSISSSEPLVSLGPKAYESPTTVRGLLHYAMLAVRIMYHLLRIRPSVIITTGGAPAPIAAYLGKLIGARIIFVEDIGHLDSRSLSGRLIYPIADRFFVQHESMRAKYGSKAEYHGSVI